LDPLDMRFAVSKREEMVKVKKEGGERDIVGINGGACVGIGIAQRINFEEEKGDIFWW